MTNPQYAPGDLVRVVASTFYAGGEGHATASSLVGHVCEVRGYDEGDDTVEVWQPNREDWLWFNPSDLEPATPPDEIEQHGVTYVRKDLVLPPYDEFCNSFKYAMTGEFSESVLVRCHDCGGNGPCKTCSRTGELDQKVYVSWTNIKAIYKRVCDLSAMRAEQEPAHD